MRHPVFENWGDSILRTPLQRTTGTAGTAALGCAALVMATVAVTTTSAQATSTTTVRTGKHLCQAATAGKRSCDSIKLVTVKVPTAKARKLVKEGKALPASARPIGFGPAGGYSPRQLAKAYGIHPNAKTKQTVAIVDAFNDPSVRHDLNRFDARYGIHRETKRSFKVIGEDGGAPPTTPDEGWAGEITLDVQSVRAMCRHCRILLVEADNDSDRHLAIAVNEAVRKGAKIVSNSYGGPERPADPKWQRKAYAHKGVAILAATGDDGWYDWDFANYFSTDHTSVSGGMSEVPASYKSVVGVGGTSLYLNPNGSRASEDVWNDNGPGDLYGASTASALGYDAGAAGSGCSTKYGAPRWQKRVKGYASLGCGTKRSEVDIAALGDEFTGFDTYETFNWCTDPDESVCFYTRADNGWATVGGTSLASPLIAGMWGLAGGPNHGVRSPAWTLYHNFKKHKSSTYDVKVGGTGGCLDQSPRACNGQLQGLVYGQLVGKTPNKGAAGLLDCAWHKAGSKVRKHRAQCYAQPGYDGVSGVGVPRGLRVFR